MTAKSRFTDCGEQEPLKGAVHGAMLVLSLACTAYNYLAWSRRGERHLLNNTLLYGALCVVEVAQVVRHERAK